MINYINKLDNWENLSFTTQTTHFLSNINKSNFILAPLVSRMLGSIVIPNASLVDASVHTGLFMGKMCTGIFVTPYNTIAVIFNFKNKVSRNLELSSALIHLIRVIECVFTAVILPFICLINPNHAYDFMNRRYGGQEDQELRQLKEQITNLEKQIELLQTKKEKKKDEDVVENPPKSVEPGVNIKEEEGESKRKRDSKIEKTSIPLDTCEIKTEDFISLQNKHKTSQSVLVSQVPPQNPIAGELFDIDQDHFTKAIQSHKLNKQNQMKKSQNVIELSFKHKKEIQDRTGDSLQILKGYIEAIVDYLDNPNKGDNLNEIDEDYEFTSFLEEFCKEFNVNFSELEQKPLKLSKENLKLVQSYFNLFIEAIENKEKTKKINNKTEKVDDDHQIQQQILQEKMEFENYKKSKLQEISLFGEYHLEDGMKKLSYIHKQVFLNLFAQCNVNYSLGFINYDDFVKQHEIIEEKIKLADTKTAINEIVQDKLYNKISLFLNIANTSKEFNKYKVY